MGKQAGAFAASSGWRLHSRLDGGLRSAAKSACADSRAPAPACAGGLRGPHAIHAWLQPPARLPPDSRFWVELLRSSDLTPFGRLCYDESALRAVTSERRRRALV